MERKKPYNRSVFQSFTMILQFGISMIVPIAMMSALGIWLDRRLGTSYLTIILFFVGAVAGAQSVYRLARNIFNRPDERYQITSQEDEVSK